MTKGFTLWFYHAMNDLSVCLTACSFKLYVGEYLLNLSKFCSTFWPNEVMKYKCSLLICSFNLQRSWAWPFYFHECTNLPFSTHWSTTRSTLLDSKKYYSWGFFHVASRVFRSTLLVLIAFEVGNFLSNIVLFLKEC